MSRRFKTVEKALRAAGGRRIERTREAVIFAMPDGARELVPEDVNDRLAKAIMFRLRDRYGVTDRDPLGTNRKVTHAPTVDLERCTATVHAKERLRLMRVQADVTFLEVTMALTCPIRVLWHDVHRSWVWEGERVAVVADVSDDGYTSIRTVLWTTSELWAEHPRPEVLT